MSTIGLRSAKHQARQDAQRDVVRKTDVFQAEAQRADDTNPAAEVQRFVQSTDEMAAALAQFHNRRDYDKKRGHLADSFERVLDEEAQPKAQQIVQVAKAHGISLAELLRHARALFSDDSDLVLVLRELLRRRQMEDVTRKRLQALLKQIEDQAEPKLLKAGINCALKARLFGKALQLSPGLLRASYRQFLQSEAREVDVYADWIGSYGYQRRATVLDFIEGALLTDIDSQDASCSRLEFGYLLGRLGQLKLLRSSDAVFVGGLLANEKVCEFNCNEADWLLFMLSVLQSPQELDTLLADVAGRSALLSRHSEHSILLQALYRACKALSPTLFVDARWQDALLEELRHMANIAYGHERIERRRESA
ncbi:type III secretion system regulator InvE [Burkholderia ubonensis]|uniref:YopN/LcrE/InvE/MxiC type III secretion system gatekeeper n=1 Tax=Burkholderia ubonensis TaxID=101571 RepID=UPI00075AFAA8|nr:YopN/LcrE/InvE/MxiC type III secretion system gatekeeper [Burkholderia ubonensis]KVU23508.1 type III secretion system regulator InvE [Burkholderia ubonensis]